MQEMIAVVGLGYVGLPLAVAFAESPHVRGVIGFDINAERVRSLTMSTDATGEVEGLVLTNLQAARTLSFTASPSALRDATAIIVTVPTPVNDANEPNLGAVRAAAAMIGEYLPPGALVVLESTVSPGVTEEVFARRIAIVSGRPCGSDWTVGYSPERINPGDREHTIACVVKVVGGRDAATTERMAALYSPVTRAGVHCASSIRVAEMAKAMENAWRDVNIAYVNECAELCRRIGISIRDVLEACETKWNAQRGFRPGMPGGHCIPVDPYYLAALARSVGMTPDVILAGRRVNDEVPMRVVTRIIQMLHGVGRPLLRPRVLILGVAFKPDVPDTRNSKVRDVIAGLQAFSCDVIAHDPLVPEREIHDGFGVPNTVGLGEGEPVDAVVVATLHRQFRDLDASVFQTLLCRPGVVFDVSGHFRDRLRGVEGIHYASL